MAKKAAAKISPAERQANRREYIETALRTNPNVRGFLNLLAMSEGTAGHGQDGYNVGFGYRPIGMDRHPGKQMGTFTNKNTGRTQSSSAAGRYQFLTGSWNDEVKRLGLKGFSPHEQDLAAVSRLMAIGAFDAVASGDFKTAVGKAKSTWVSLPGGGAAVGQSSHSASALNKMIGPAMEKARQQVGEARTSDYLMAGAPTLLPETAGRVDMSGQVSEPQTHLTPGPEGGLFADAGQMLSRQPPVDYAQPNLVDDALSRVAEAFTDDPEEPEGYLPFMKNGQRLVAAAESPEEARRFESFKPYGEAQRAQLINTFDMLAQAQARQAGEPSLGGKYPTVFDDDLLGLINAEG